MENTVTDLIPVCQALSCNFNFNDACFYTTSGLGST